MVNPQNDEPTVNGNIQSTPVTPTNNQPKIKISAPLDSNSKSLQSKILDEFNLEDNPIDKLGLKTPPTTPKKAANAKYDTEEEKLAAQEQRKIERRDKFDKYIQPLCKELQVKPRWFRAHIHTIKDDRITEYIKELTELVEEKQLQEKCNKQVKVAQITAETEKKQAEVISATINQPEDDEEGFTEEELKQQALEYLAPNYDERRTERAARNFVRMDKIVLENVSNITYYGSEGTMDFRGISDGISNNEDSFVEAYKELIGDLAPDNPLVRVAASPWSQIISLHADLINHQMTINSRKKISDQS